MGWDGMEWTGLWAMTRFNELIPHNNVPTPLWRPKWLMEYMAYSDQMSSEVRILLLDTNYRWSKMSNNLNIIWTWYNLHADDANWQRVFCSCKVVLQTSLVDSHPKPSLLCYAMQLLHTEKRITFFTGSIGDMNATNDLFLRFVEYVVEKIGRVTSRGKSCVRLWS